MAQRFARHASPLTTIEYTHPSDEELYEGIRNLPSLMGSDLMSRVP